MIRLIKLFIFLIVFKCTQNELAVDVCQERFSVITQLTQEDCPEGTFLLDDPASCFPKCVKIEVNVKDLPLCSPSKPCLPGHLCQGSGRNDLDKKCQLDPNSCFKYYHSYFINGNPTNPLINSLWKPDCLPDGTFAPKQRKGESNNGRYFCYSSQGKRIFGHSWSMQAENMTCACSRRKAELLMGDPIDFNGLHCDDQGNYEPLQCHDGFCWCAHPMTGTVLSKVVTDAMMKLLPCYSRKLNVEQYHRQCDSHLRAQKLYLKKLRAHGTVEINVQTVNCDYDGTYGPNNVINGERYCVWKDNKPLGPWKAPIHTNEMNCNCARDTKLFDLIGQERPLKCAEDGSYEPLQKTVSATEIKYFCVDSDGFQSNYEEVDPNAVAPCDKFT